MGRSCATARKGRPPRQVTVPQIRSPLAGSVPSNSTSPSGLAAARGGSDCPPRSAPRGPQAPSARPVRWVALIRLLIAWVVSPSDKPEAAAQEDTPPAVPEYPSEFLARLPAALRRDTPALEAEDHSPRVRTPAPEPCPARRTLPSPWAANGDTGRHADFINRQPGQANVCPGWNASSAESLVPGAPTKGSVITTSVAPGSDFSIHSLPEWCSTIVRLIERPSPRPESLLV